jgi:phage-related protein
VQSNKRDFLCRSSGKMPVREWLMSLDKRDGIDIGGDIATAEYNWPVGPPRCKLLSHGIFEIRSHISAGRMARVLFFIESNAMYLLHGFIKKSRKTPLRDIDIAKKRAAHHWIACSMKNRAT